MANTIEKFQSSELSRNSARVFSAAEETPVLVTRRDGEDLILMSQTEANARRQLMEFAAQLIAVTTDDRGTLTDRMSDRFPWILALSPADRQTCSRELVEAARASFATQQPQLAIAALTAWRETAKAVASGDSLQKLDWLNDPEPVGRPF